VGTATGLVGLIADIRAAEVADGVTLRPLEQGPTLDLLVTEVAPALGMRDEREVVAAFVE
ncbi:MAG: hypothetical protein ICV72_10455, partial [Aldersonia sp.]|nr:hypothetical protein [Aldersonia sp.]